MGPSPWLDLPPLALSSSLLFRKSCWSRQQTHANQMARVLLDQAAARAGLAPLQHARRTSISLRLFWEGARREFRCPPHKSKEIKTNPGE